MKSQVKQIVYINGRFLTQVITGVQRYALQTLIELDKWLVAERVDQQNTEWIILVPSVCDYVPRLKMIKVKQSGNLNGHLWEQLQLPVFARDGLLFSFGLTGPIFHFKQIITLHDANLYRLPETYNWKFRLWYKFIIKTLINTSVERVIVVSSFAAREATKFYGAKANLLRVVTEGWQHLQAVSTDESILDRCQLRGKPFALAVSSHTPNKNFKAIAKAIEILGSKAPVCAVAGQIDQAIYKNTQSSGEKILQLGYVSDEELKALYIHATCLIFPSFYEGFGIPPLEAMACGCPVIASTADALQEVCGNAALYFNPANPAELVDHIQNVFTDAELQQKMKKRGYQRAQIFSWTKAARLNYQCIKEVICAV